MSSIKVEYQARMYGKWHWLTDSTHPAEDIEQAKHRADQYRAGGVHARVVAESGAVIYVSPDRP